VSRLLNSNLSAIEVGDSGEYRVLRCLNAHKIRVDSDNKR
jgi:hypothetical protein